ncbi:hypothetical protein QFC19_001196 [Naganishia cerealis]|uniref:Uncharacterized protein n=1 Tax=Naganishia cerealis TaxID=610337 RepID=A0ACC2WIF9_9TREE|nr:hypothetical protein QFC19_001196 [Naganishia cerealis]
MVDGSLDLLVAYARLISVPSVIVALPSSWSSSSETSQVPFTKIISGLEECGFYFESDQPDEVHKGRRIWEKWSPDDRNELIDAIGRCWGSILHSSIEKVEYLKQSDLVPGNLSVRTESLSIQQSESQYVTAAGSSEQNFLAEEPRVLWRVSIMATTRESPVRLAAQESISQDWVLVLHKETSVGPDPTNLQGKIAGTQHDEANASYDSAGRQLRRPSIATNTSNSSISSKMTHTSFKSSASGVHQKIEIKSGVPLPIRAASEITQFALPSEGFIANKTVITPSMDRSLGYLGANATVSSGGDLPRSDVTRGAPVFADETSDEPVIWNDTAVAPVNPEDLMKLVINSPVGMLLATPELRIYWVNDRWYDIVKLERGQDLNTWIDGVHPDTLPTLMEVLQGLMQDKAKRTGDIRWKHGSWSTFTAQVLRDADGAVTAITATLDDCTQRKTLELAQLETLKEQEATARRIAEEASARAKELAEWQSQTRILEKRTKEFAQMAEISAIALTCAKPDGELIWANQAFCDLHDLQPHEINQWPSTVLPADLEALNERWQKLKNGRVLQVQTVPSIAADNKDSLTFVSAIMDVTSEVRHHEAVERLNEERIKEQTRLAGEAEERRKAAVFQKEQQELFIDVTSHELRNSINPILQSALLVKASLLEARMGYSGKDDGRNFVNGMNIQEDLEACDAIIDSANQMERVANDVLADLSAILI